MRIFLISIFFLVRSIFCFAHEPGNAFSSSDTVAKKRSSKQQLFIGFNAGQVIWRDLELHFMYRPHKRHSLMLGAGYDFNRTIFRQRKFDPDKPSFAGGQGENDKDFQRYFFGEGPAIRIVYDFNFFEGFFNTMFFSISGIYKIHKYSNASFVREGQVCRDRCESGKQTILGLCIYHGVFRERNFFTMRWYWGAGVRKFQSRYQWKENPGSAYNQACPAENFNLNKYVPTIDAGLIVLFKVKVY